MILAPRGFLGVPACRWSAAPDAELLDLFSEALHHLKAAEAASKNRSWPRHTKEDEARDAEIVRLFWEHRGKARSLMFRARKLSANTAAGIYAKAPCVRFSATGAAEFAMSLAEDLVNNPALRASLWSADHAAA